MSSRLPIFIIIPHGGYKIPEELLAFCGVNEYDIFLEADTCANELYALDDRVKAKLDTEVSRLFIDTDRSHLHLPPRYGDGVVKQETSSGKAVFHGDVFPDHIALANLIRRYYSTFHDTLQKTIAEGDIRLILECHTMMPVGPKNAVDKGMPRPLLSITSCIEKDGKTVHAARAELAAGLADSMKKFVSDEDATVAEKLTVNNPPFGGFIMQKYAGSGIPLLRISVSRSLFLNDRYFNYDFLKVDELRLKHLRDRLWDGISRFYTKYIR